MDDAARARVSKDNQEIFEDLLGKEESKGLVAFDEMHDSDTSSDRSTTKKQAMEVEVEHNTDRIA